MNIHEKDIEYRIVSKDGKYVLTVNGNRDLVDATLRLKNAVQPAEGPHKAQMRKVGPWQDL